MEVPMAEKLFTQEEINRIVAGRLGRCLLYTSQGRLSPAVAADKAELPRGVDRKIQMFKYRPDAGIIGKR